MLFKSIFVGLWLTLAIVFSPPSHAGWFFRDIQSPTIPGGLTASPASSSQIDLAWTASRDNVGVKGYRVFRNGAYIATVLSPKFSNTGLTAATTYKYTVAAFDAAGNTSRKSSEVSATTQDVTTPPPPPPPSSDVVGYLGCSMTMGVANGALNLGSTIIWNSKPEYGGGGIWQLAQDFNSGYWSEFQRAYNAQPTTTFWWELCSIVSTKDHETYENAVAVIDEIKRRVPGAVVYVSAQPGYDPVDHVCTNAGEDGPTRMATLAAQLTTAGDALAGPTMGPLAYPSQLKTGDSCHPNTDGEQLMGTQFQDFFLTKPQPPSASAGIASGIYVVDTEPNVDAALASPYVDGLLVRVRWEQLEPKEGQYNFKPLCDKIVQAHKAGKAVSLVTYPVPAPAWLLAKVPSSEKFTIQMGQSVSAIVPWSQTGLSALNKLIQAEAGYQCEGVPIKAHPSVKQIDTTNLALSVRDSPSGATQAQMLAGITQAVKYWHDAFTVPNDDKSYYFSTFPYRDKTVDAGAIVKEVLKLYPLQHTMVENWGVAGVGDTSVLKLAKYKIVQACGYFSSSKIKCSDTGRADNTPQNAFEKILSPLGGVVSLQVYADDVVNSAYAKDMAFLHDKLKPAIKE